MDPELGAAIEAVSAGGRYLYTRANLLAELARRGCYAGWLAARAGAAALPGLLGPDVPAEWETGALDADVFDYAVRRWFVFDRAEPCILFARNGFHQKIEVGLLALPGPGTATRFPAGVWRLMERQLASGVATTFYLFHDGGPSGVDFAARVEAALAPHGRPRLVEGGLTAEQTEQLGFRQLEEMTPLELMRWAYRRVVRTAEEIGFG